MSALAQEFLNRYPILQEIWLSASRDAPPESIPPFLGFLLALAESDEERGCCLVLPDPTGIAPVFAALLALVRLRREFDTLTRIYATQGIEKGRLVKVNPTGHVYIYDGVFEDKPHLFRLREIDTTDDARSLPVTDVLRLEPTERKRPRGRLHTDLRHHARLPLDLILGINSWGNESLYRNRVLFLSSQSGFERFLKSTVVASSVSSRFGASAVLSDLLPWGFVNAAGALVSANAYQVTGEPLIAVTHSVDHLADACATLAHASEESAGDTLPAGFATGGRVVIADGAARILRNLQAFDEIEGTVKTIIIASSEERDAFSILEERGLNIWHASPEEVLAGSSSRMDLPFPADETASPSERREDDDGRGTSGQHLFGALLSCARNQRDFKLTSVACADERLDLAADALVLAADSLEEPESEDKAMQGIRSLFNLLFRVAERVGPLDTAERRPLIDRIEEAKQRIESRFLWLPEETVALSRDAAGALLDALFDPALGKQKADALAALLSPGKAGTSANERTVIVPHYSSSREHVDQWLRESVRTAIVCTDRLLSRGEWFDNIVVLSWPGSARFGSLVRRYPAPHMSLIAYPFEQDWMQQFRRRMERELRRSDLPGARKAKILGLPVELLSPTPGAPESTAGPEPDSRLSIFRVEGRVLRRRKGGRYMHDSGEDAVEARYLGFVGDTYAYLKEGSVLPVVTALVQSAINGVEPRSSGVLKRVASELRQGDFVLFREGSDHDVVRLFAEMIAGTETYQHLLSRATSWRLCLQGCAPDARRVHSRLREAGLARTHVTIRNWLYDEEQTGPQDKDDLLVIAEVAGPLPHPVEDVWRAIEEIRGLHRAAGHRISEWLMSEVPRYAHRLLDGEARLDLNFGAFYVVEVEEIASHTERVPYSMANELLWDVR